ncbi:MAG TPA: type I methionyl aminopeptidase [Candidatus Omnitrophota bacterium]|nr:type I methionyl aminopeptidase [Candidatus Omnitrophota bacterium]HPD83945.1 type I methionyl aminopeptidase [Candidatus Omnitrophota bacterium]HRZ02802.1 type I methionyl aminopeptidase [Candidatus Omnitrophota bacterium]
MQTERLIRIKSEEEIECLRRSGKLLASIVRELKGFLKLGLTTKEIDGKVEELIAEHDAYPAFKGYRGFPACACISLNNEVVHGIPSERRLKEGDIASIDIGIVFEKFYADMAFTVGMGKISPDLKRLIEVTEKSLYKGIEQAVIGNHLSDISFAVQSFVESNNFSVVRDFVGHGIGRRLHEDPEVPNFGLPHSGPVLREGMVLAIEPMVNVGKWQTRILDDGWTVVTQDGKPSAHFEHTVAITKEGPEILTQ